MIATRSERVRVRTRDDPARVFCAIEGHGDADA